MCSGDCSFSGWNVTMERQSKPTQRVYGMPSSLANALKPSRRRAPDTARALGTSLVRSSWIVALAAASDRASPPKVVKKKTSRSSTFMYLANPVSTPSGRPLATALENTARCGVTPKYSCAPPTAMRKPVHISSKMRSAPCFSHRSLTACRNPGAGAANVVGSRITHAVWSSIEAARPSRSL